MPDELIFDDSGLHARTARATINQRALVPPEKIQRGVCQNQSTHSLRDGQGYVRDPNNSQNNQNKSQNDSDNSHIGKKTCGRAVEITYVCMYACMYVCVFACMRVCMYGCPYVCTYVCVCMNVCGLPSWAQTKKALSSNDTKGSPLAVHEHMQHVCVYVDMDVCMYVCMYKTLYDRTES